MEKLKVVALLGKARSGKDTAGAMMCELANGHQMAFADKLKQIAGEMFNLTHDDLYSDKGKVQPTQFDCLMCPECKSVEAEVIVLDRVKNGRCKLCGCIGDVKVFASKWTPRTILQFLGTEGFRRIDTGVWVRYALSQAKGLLSRDAKPPKFVVITDCRFRSEAQAIWAAGGEVWRIKRPETDKDAQGLKGHASEMEQESISDSECQAVLNNTGSLDDLRAAVNVQLHRFLRA